VHRQETHVIKLSEVVEALTGEQKNNSPEPFTWTTPIRHDPSLIAQLQRANLELRALFSIAAQVSRDSQFEPAADALSQCMQKLREVQRLEALRLYPVLAHQAASNKNSAATVAYLRLRAHTLSRRFLRLCENLMVTCRAHSPKDTDFVETGSALDNYVSAKELQLYQAYSFTAPTSSQVA
jgi:hypothetical protein